MKLSCLVSHYRNPRLRKGKDDIGQRLVIGGTHDRSGNETTLLGNSLG
ncbi:MAG TPA: hypothetical protein VLH40_08420 [Atribacteraceae bacterium]|nr:hypothetical protein [Atribacteraceae bacterium]